MAQLATLARTIIDFELASSTTEDKRWVKAYETPSLEDLVAVAAGQTDQVSIFSTLLEHMIVEWSWEDGDQTAPITAENIRRLDPVDFFEIINHLDFSSLTRNALDQQKKSS